jgi:hypothetical protein
MLLYLDDHDCENEYFFRVRIWIRDGNGCFCVIDSNRS